MNEKWLYLNLVVFHANHTIDFSILVRCHPRFLQDFKTKYRSTIYLYYFHVFSEKKQRTFIKRTDPKLISTFLKFFKNKAKYFGTLFALEMTYLILKALCRFLVGECTNTKVLMLFVTIDDIVDHG